MTESSLTVRSATVDERERIVALLRANDLPATDLDESPVRLFVGVDDGDLVGVGGYELYGTEALLRSVVVPTEERHRGYGSAICDQLERRATAAGVEMFYLLTTTATDFFQRRGYEQIPRAEVPEAIRRTGQFANLCPDSATCLRKTFE